MEDNDNNISHKIKVKVLFICYYFPPLGGGAVVRATRLSKYLSNSNIDLTVLTVDEKYIFTPNRDNYLLKDIYKENPQINIVRTESWEPSGDLRIKLREDTSMNKPKLFSLGSLRRIVKSIILPDEKMLWYSKAVNTAVALNRKEKYNVIYATSPPFSALIIGKAISKKTGAAYIIELRDDWIGNKHFEKRFIAGIIEKFMEKKVVKTANKIILATESGKKLYMKKYPSMNIDDFHVVHNSYDENDFRNIPPLTPVLEKLFQGKKMIVHTGGLDISRDPTKFVEALKILFTQKPETEIGFLQIGQIEDKYLKLFEDEIVKGKIHFIQKLEHSMCLSCLKAGFISLLIPSIDANTAIPGKLYEYLRIGNKVLTIGKNHSINEIAPQLPNLTQVAPDTDEILRYLIFEDKNKYENDQINCNNSIVKSFEAKEMAKSVARIIHNTID